VRKRLLQTWRRMRETMSPVKAWAAIQADPALRDDYIRVRGKGGFVRAGWDEAAEIIAAANAYTAKTWGPGPGVRLLADPGDVDGLLCRGLALSQPDGRHLHVVLRLVLRPAAVLAADLGRADRRSGIRRLVQFGLPDPLGLERAADPDARTRISTPRRAIAARSPR
jgi:hypothetical protein